MQLVEMDVYREELPDSCPPATVVAPSTPTLWRLIRSSSLSDSDFDSQRKRSPKRNYPDECLARSVSLVTSLAACRAAIKSPYMARMKFTHAVEIPCRPPLGVWHKDGETHVNWWPYAGVDPVALAGQVEDLNG